MPISRKTGVLRAHLHTRRAVEIVSASALAVVLLAVAPAVPISARVIGHMEPPRALSRESFAALPPAQRVRWQAYLERSVAAMTQDKAALAAERSAVTSPAPPPPEAKGHDAIMPLDRAVDWYASAPALAIADNIVSFQTPAGGWGKNQDRRAPPRAPGQSFIAHDDRAGIYEAQDGAGGWSFVGTIDNDATTTELTFLARVQAQLPGAKGDPYRAAFLKGVRYLLQAEFPDGGWPQVYPLQGGYHDALTLNDDAMLEVTELLQRTAQGQGDYAFVPTAQRQAAAAAVARAFDVLLATQVVIGGKRTIWAQQYDPLTRAPVGARNFEPIALATGESAAVLRFLMKQPHPSPAMRAAITQGAAWFAAHALRDLAWPRASGPEGRRLVAQPGAPLLWARFYDPATGKPIYGDRDRSIHDDVNEISLERRNGYAWLGTSGAPVAAAYEKWRSTQGG
jgi:PelA/Pel-15E family pectate lyase